MALFRCSSGGGGGTLSEELVWENPSPSSSLSAKTINESTSGWVSGKVISDYDYFGFKLSSSQTSSGYPYTTYWFKKGEIYNNTSWKTTVNAFGSQSRGRVIESITNDGIQIGVGYQNNTGSTSSTNGVITKIFGLRVV